MQRFFVWLGRKLFPNANPAAKPQSKSARSASEAALPNAANSSPSTRMPKSATEHAQLRESGRHAVAKQVPKEKARELQLEGETAPSSTEEDDFNPYNSGRFDRSKNWELRKGK